MHGLDAMLGPQVESEGAIAATAALGLYPGPCQARCVPSMRWGLASPFIAWTAICGLVSGSRWTQSLQRALKMRDGPPPAFPAAPMTMRHLNSNRAGKPAR